MGTILPLRKVAKSPPPPPGEIFAACDQHFHCKFRCRMCSSVPGGGKVQHNPPQKVGG